MTGKRFLKPPFLDFVHANSRSGRIAPMNFRIAP
jgi:hypothetical protein